jgi:hypothetical protein
MPYKSREELAYAAGLYEGEGTVCASYGTFLTKSGERRPRQSPGFQLKIGMTDLEPLERFQEAVGFGTIYGPYEKKQIGWKPYYHYSVDSFEKTQAAIAMLWSWLSPRRREQAAAALTAEKR